MKANPEREAWSQNGREGFPGRSVVQHIAMCHRSECNLKALIEELQLYKSGVVI